MSVLDSRDTSFGGTEEDTLRPGARPANEKPRPTGMRFLAEMDMAEIDERGRPGPVSNAKGRELSRANIVIASRKLVYPGRLVGLAVHLIDDRPVPLIGRVYSCVYDSDGLYRVDIDLMSMDGHAPVREWAMSRERAAGTRRPA
ncbi:MAG: hypothetical protein SFY96_11720 [Planctomycetota bacterium]|nr:hypothetical protein [Planctomycetota bacterium]